MTGMPTPSRSSTLASWETNRSQSVTSPRASTDASRQTIHSRGQSNSKSVANGTLAAATSAWARSRSPSPNYVLSNSSLAVPKSRAERVATGGQSGKLPEQSTRMVQIPLPQQSRPQPSRSPSQQAAILAAARAAPSNTSTRGDSSLTRTRTQSKPSVAPKPRRLSEYSRTTSLRDNSKSVDSTPTIPTSSLVNLFEQKSNPSSPIPESHAEPLVVRLEEQLQIKSPKPLKPTIGIPPKLTIDSGDSALDMRSQDVSTRRVSTGERPWENSYASSSDSHREEPRRKSIPKIESPLNSLPSGGGLRVNAVPGRNFPMSPSPLRNSNSTNEQKPLGGPSRDLKAQAYPVLSHSKPMATIPGQFHSMYPRFATPLSSEDDLANAIVASSLASSRGASPARMDPPPIPPRRTKTGHNHTLSYPYHHMLPGPVSVSRTPSPAKTGMLRTLRHHEESVSDSEDEYHPYGKHRKKRLVRKHPNKHHEGDRKRWRDAVTERERKRYEGVWAANKGIHYSFTPDEQRLFQREPAHDRTLEMKKAVNGQVSNLLVREIWSRSRLPRTELEMVWDLVDHESVGRLYKEEFVVGMWLIDQRLKGRKLPVKVSESVWASVRSLQGIKIRQ